MREPAFLRQNRDKWLEYETLLFGETAHSTDPDHLANLYIQLTDDLAYARTHYPRSRTHRYLNGLAARTHLLIYKEKLDTKKTFLSFWTRDLPLIYRSAHRFMFWSLLIFLGSALLGYVSVLQDETFVRTILGDDYVNMTIDNIQQGKPTNVYASEGQLETFVRIAYNNITVMMIMFISGLFFGIGSIIGLPITIWGVQGISGLVGNAIMVGAFLGFFKTYNVLDGALPVVMLHGTLELSAIVITAAAGMMLGNGLLFPGTFKRGLALQKAAREGVLIMVGLVPVVLLAAFIEGYLTRFAEMPWPLKALIIGLSAAFILWYYVLYPIVVAREAGYEQSLKQLPPHSRT